MKYLKIILFITFIISFLGISCKTNKIETSEKTDDNQSSIISEAIKNYFDNEDSLYIKPNKEGQLFLYISEKRETSVNPVNNISFFVYDKETNQIIYKNDFSNAEIEWYNSNQLLLTRFFGIINSKDGSNIKKYIIDLSTKELQEIQNKNNKSNF